MSWWPFLSVHYIYILYACPGHRCDMVKILLLRRGKSKKINRKITIIIVVLEMMILRHANAVYILLLLLLYCVYHWVVYYWTEHNFRSHHRRRLHRTSVCVSYTARILHYISICINIYAYCRKRYIYVYNIQVVILIVRRAGREGVVDINNNDIIYCSTSSVRLLLLFSYLSSCFMKPAYAFSHIPEL